MDTLYNIAVFCDHENLALGAKDAKYEKFDVGLALERVLDKGKVVFKKSYSDWDRYKSDRKSFHEHAFELVEIPHVSYSGKNSADIRLVVDALDLCYTKPHVDAFVIMSGDSDFSPLVSKLRENNKQVIGMGIKQSSSNLLIENCDEFIYYDDLVLRREGGDKKKRAKRTKKASTEAGGKAMTSKDRREEGIEMVVDTIDAMIEEREGMLWGPSIRRAIKRKRPNFTESYYGFRTFNEILEAARDLGLVDLKKDEEKGNYGILSLNTL